MSFVPEGEYIIPENMKRYFKFYDSDKIRIDKSFYIQNREITVSDFREYFDNLDESMIERVGNQWSRSLYGERYANEKPVEYVSWDSASDYAKWISVMKKKDYRLPTIKQWIAASFLFSEDNPVTNNDKPVSKVRFEVDHLLGNLREWSSEPCGSEKYNLLGNDYITDISEIGKAYCAKAKDKWKAVGFRLVLIDNE